MGTLLFGRADLENRLAAMTPEEIDELPFGVIQIDDNGCILLYNATEGAITGRDPAEMIGRDFFNEVAPCGHTETFYGRFREGVRSGDLNEIFDYTFDYRMVPTKVRVHMKRALSGDSYWIFVKRISAPAA
ncbi:MAG: photoactive yellow protein [Halorhodospira halophila]|uniref:photoactive yellow protein n=1 Tax=Halorhodospira halophila TaxID=1053 RepID=UPI0026EE4AC9|nr:photoactive yellow protein [Halorhodospira halophila]MCC3750022.1 photoactive yellow protein [Halorhodospira halophila]